MASVKSEIAGYVFSKDFAKIAWPSLAVLAPALASTVPETGSFLSGIKPVLDQFVSGVPSLPLVAIGGTFAIEKLWEERENLRNKSWLATPGLLGAEVLIAGAALPIFLSEINHFSEAHSMNAVLALWAGLKVGTIALDRWNSFAKSTGLAKILTTLAGVSLVGLTVYNTNSENKLDINNILSNLPAGINLSISQEDLRQIQMGPDQILSTFSYTNTEQVQVEAQAMEQKAEVLTNELEGGVAKEVVQVTDNKDLQVVNDVAFAIGDVTNSIANAFRPEDRQVVRVDDAPQAMQENANAIVEEAKQNVSEEAQVQEAQIKATEEAKSQEMTQPEVGVTLTPESETTDEFKPVSMLLQCFDGENGIQGPYKYIVQPGDVTNVDEITGQTNALFNIGNALKFSERLGDYNQDGVVDVFDGAQVLCDAQDRALNCLNVRAGEVINIPCPDVK